MFTLHLISDVAIRSNNEPWLGVVQDWLNVLLPMIRPHLYNNGGNILMLQVENEYGAFGCEHEYITKLQGMLIDHLGTDTQIFTTDGNRDVELGCGKSPVPNTLTTVDFGPKDNIHNSFLLLKVFNRRGPLVNSELYTGWCDYWGQRHQTTEAAYLGIAIDKILTMNASVSLYMWHGGTNFGLTSGGEVVGNNPTSYDYDAPQSECGDVKLDKYWAIRNATTKHFGENTSPVPPNSKKWGGGVVKLSHSTRLVNLLNHDLGLFQYPRTMESLGVYSGVVAYVHNTSVQRMEGTLVLSGIRDRAYVMVDGVYVKVAKQANSTIIISSSKSLILFVENMGHLNYKSAMKHNFKGLLNNITLDGVTITGWQHYLVPVIAAQSMSQQGVTGLSPIEHDENLSDRDYLSTPFLFNMKPLMPGGPTLFYTWFQGNPDKLDSFLDLTGWSKGFATLNDHDLGRYWPDAGPQYTLYVPGLYFMPGYNVLTLTEMQSSYQDLTVTFTTVPRIDGPFDPTA